MDATGSSMPRAGAASNPHGARASDEAGARADGLDDEVLDALILRGHPLLFLPGPSLGDGIAVVATAP